MTIHDTFNRFAHLCSKMVGSPWTFVAAVITIVVWGVSGPAFGYSDTWQLVINTGTTIVTFLMVFLIQNTQNRDARAIHLKLDELLRAIKEARTDMVELENLPEKEMNRLEGEFKKLSNGQTVCSMDEESTGGAQPAAPVRRAR